MVSNLNNPGKVLPLFSALMPLYMLCLNATINKVGRTPAKAWLEQPRCHQFQGGFQQMNWKETSCCQITHWGPSGCTPSEAKCVSTEKRILPMLTNSIHDVSCIYSFPLQLPISLWSKYKGQCCQQEGKEVKRPQPLHHPIACGERH